MINNLLYFYLGSCVGCYISLALYNKESYKGASKVDVILGLLLCLVWPIVLPITLRGNK